MGGYALDGCREFISRTGGGTKKKTKKADDYFHYCDACGCHRNFHRKEMIQNGVPLGSNGEESHTAAPSSSMCLLLMGLGPFQYNLVQPQPPQAGGVNWNGYQHRVFHGDDDDDDDDDEELNNNGGMVDDQQVGKKTNPKKKPKMEN
ncbi:hypothetical protein FEM48_Zijuj02G0173100 [Ziziphus jujuba var. spinosa]|nr:hypothetical protein FEM48_Zijuj02G0173100 [Ziziphus jujuba var. spinosa]